MKGQNILIVEDEPNLGSTLNEYLNDKGHHCQLATNCSQAREIFQASGFKCNVVLMDIGLPDGDGLALARELREIQKDFILLFLSAQNDPETKLEGLNMGAEDYITKPFDLRELAFRLKRSVQIHEMLDEYDGEITLGSLKVHFKNYQIKSQDNEIYPLGQKECAILELLYSQKNEVVSRDEIIEKIWGEDQFPTNRTVDNYIVKLRKLLEADTTKNTSIRSVRGIGYQLNIK